MTRSLESRWSPDFVFFFFFFFWGTVKKPSAFEKNFPEGIEAPNVEFESEKTSDEIKKNLSMGPPVLIVYAFLH